MMVAPGPPARLFDAFTAALVGDALALPVHWYYDTAALDRDYGAFNHYQPPRSPHPDSILWRSQYTPRTPEADILHDQARFWGQRGIHYHQFLPAGGNTLNYQLAAELYRHVLEHAAYDPDAWIHHYIRCLRTPGWHRDTYVEEVHRGFFDRLAQGIPPTRCAVPDLHIGALAPVPALTAALHALPHPPAPDDLEEILVGHVGLTHAGPEAAACTRGLVRMLLSLAGGEDLPATLERHAAPWIGLRALDALSRLEDRDIIGRRYTPACYLPDSFLGSLALVYKYRGDPRGGLLANARCGGDNCHRAAVVGPLLAFTGPLPDDWLRDLIIRPSLPAPSPSL